MTHLMVLLVSLEIFIFFFIEKKKKVEAHRVTAKHEI